MRRMHRRIAVLLCGLLLCAVSSAWATGVHVSLESSAAQPNPGDIITVSLNVFQADAEFNAFDAFIQFDPTRLEFVPAATPNLQIGPVMTANCGNFFHLFTPNASYLEVHLSLLCPNTFATGPGVIYQVQFRVLGILGATQVSWMPGTEFYRAGFFVRPAELLPLSLAVGGVNAVGPRDGKFAGFSINTPRPNPCQGSGPVTMEYSVATPERVVFEIYDSQGRRLAARSVSDAGAGRHSFTWAGLRLAPGRYVVRMSSATGARAERGWVVLR